MVVQLEMVSPPKLKGKTQEDPAAGPPTVMQLAPDPELEPVPVVFPLPVVGGTAAI